MADKPAEVTIRNPATQETRTIARASVPFFPGWELLDAAGRKAAHQPTTNRES